MGLVNKCAVQEVRDVDCIPFDFQFLEVQKVSRWPRSRWVQGCCTRFGWTGGSREKICSLVRWHNGVSYSSLLSTCLFLIERAPFSTTRGRSSGFSQEDEVNEIT